MSTKNTGKNPAEPRAEHGTPTELSWTTGEGRQPYANQGDAEKGEPSRGDEFIEGDRGELSGRNQEQLDEVKKTP